jgi:transcriptional regulator with XRE-family HTH domain
MTRRTEDDVSAGTAIALARDGYGYSIRELSRRAGVSAGQISRLESGEVQRPAVETLVALARAVDRNPLPLLIVGGHISGSEARGHLGRLLAEGSEFAQAWGSAQDRQELDRMRTAVTDSSTDEQTLRAVAQKLFLTAETEETLWHDAYLALPAQGNEAEALRDLIGAWPLMNPTRRVRVLEYVRDQVALSRVEFQQEMQALDGGDK